MREWKRHYLVLFLSIISACLALDAAAVTTTSWAAEGSDWYHALEVAHDLRASPPDAPVVLLLGGSCARESTVSDADWAADVRRSRGSPVVTYNLASRNQTFEQGVALVKELPRVPMLVFIGLNRGRFTSPPQTTASTAAVASKAAQHSQHHYKGRAIWTEERKQKEVRYWLSQRYPVFTERYDANLAQLDELIAVCKQRGYDPVLLELPRDVEVIGGAFDEPIQQYQKGGRELASRHAIPFVDFIGEAQFVSEDFFDVDHLADSGRPKFQSLLADETVELLGGHGTQAAVGTPWLFASAVMLLAGVLVIRRRRVVVRRRRRARRSQIPG